MPSLTGSEPGLNEQAGSDVARGSSVRSAPVPRHIPDGKEVASPNASKGIIVHKYQPVSPVRGDA